MTPSPLWQTAALVGHLCTHVLGRYKYALGCGALPPGVRDFKAGRGPGGVFNASFGADSTPFAAGVGGVSAGSSSLQLPPIGSSSSSTSSGGAPAPALAPGSKSKKDVPVHWRTRVMNAPSCREEQRLKGLFARGEFGQARPESPTQDDG